MKNILRLEARGCDFIKNSPDAIFSDLGNYRLFAPEIDAKNGKKEYQIEFTLWRNRGHFRTINKRTSKLLKKPIFEIDIPLGLSINTYFIADDGCCYGDIKTEEKINLLNLTYTKKDLLKAVNLISKKQYDDIEIY